MIVFLLGTITGLVIGGGIATIVILFPGGES
jgi:hypothetical protein